MPLSLNQFVQSLSKSGLMAGADISAFLESLSPANRPSDGEALAHLLVRAGKLTPYQAAAASQGKARNLVFDEYVILDKIGQGGMGVVLKAEHRRLKRLVAVKILPAKSMQSPDAVKRFYREVEAAGKLTHPNIVTAYDAREYAGSHCLVMEYIEGKDLASIVKEHGPLPVGQAVECLLQAARGLQYAHEQGIVHRDIKPGNLLLDKKGTVKVLDMGLARIEQTATAEAGGERLTQSGQIMGTCDYMAPEQAMDTHKVDPRADIYSLGCTLYRLLTGKTPYEADSFAKLFLAHLNDPIPSLCEARPDVPAALDAVYQKMIAKQPQDRQQSMAEVIAELEACQRRPARSSPSSGSGVDQSLLENLSFLQESTGGAAAAIKKKQKPRAEGTLAPRSERSTGTMLRLAAKLRAVPTQKKVLLGAVGLLLLGVLGAVLLTVTLRTGQPRRPAAVIRAPGGSDARIVKPGDEPHDRAPVPPDSGKQGRWPTQSAPDAEGFESLFDGKTLRGWDGDPAVWRVEEGAITGEMTSPLKENTFLVWRGGDVDDFELRFDYRFSGNQGNSGVQYRGFEDPEKWGKWVLAGYQFDIDAENRYTGGLWDERGRSALAPRGRETVIGQDHKPRVVGEIGNPALLHTQIKSDDWNSCRIVARGFAFLHEINGQLVAKTTDEDEQQRRTSGLLALQVHKSWPTKIQFRNIRLKRSGSPSAGAPPLAVAPFDAAQAKKHQAAWAKYLGVPVEMTNSIGMKFALIPPGEFRMGSTEAEAASGPGANLVSGLDTNEFLVERVSWQAAEQCCRDLSTLAEEKSENRCYRLPTEAVHMGQRDYSRDPCIDPQAAAATDQPAVRGGAFENDALICRSAFRVPFSPGGNVRTGFRLVCEIPMKGETENRKTAK